MVTHGGYDNTDVNRDINCMFPITRLKELASKGEIGGIAKKQIGFMGGGGNFETLVKKNCAKDSRSLKGREYGSGIVDGWLRHLSPLCRVGAEDD